MLLPFDIHSLFLSFWLPVVRIGAMLMVMPIFGAQFIPKRIKIMLSVAISVVVFPLLSHTIPTPLPRLDLLHLVLLSAQQILVGAMLGIAVNIIFQAFVVAGEICAMQMGLGFASMNDPQNGVSVPTLSQFYLTIISLIFLAMNGHLMFIQAIIESFTVFPMNGFEFAELSVGSLLQMGSWIFVGGFKIALPAIAALLMVNMSIGIITKATPQINIFAIGFPLTMLIGMIILWFFALTILPQFTDLLQQLMVQIKGWII